ncbi:hypothetical protein QQ056_08190 [Oscillatoria laete-virens NRMC-F 0139]|nr:hypothetical protein [Oscillatoria laete-virens NRMC-F 0139]
MRISKCRALQEAGCFDLPKPADFAEAAAAGALLRTTVAAGTGESTATARTTETASAERGISTTAEGASAIGSVLSGTGGTLRSLRCGGVMP